MRYIYFARKNEVMLDIDSSKAYDKFQRNLKYLDGLTRKITILHTRRGHYHVYLTLKKRHEYPQLSALQTFLGSDIRRELANYSRILARASKPILLIEYDRVKHFREPDIVCSCPRKYKGKKLANCIHLRSAKGHKAKYGYLSTRLKYLGIDL